MAHTVYLHTGTPKSGTTSIQDFLVQNKATLRDEDHLLFPGEKWADQVNAARHLLRLDREALGEAPAWDRLAAEVREWTGSAVISMEWLGGSGTHGVRHMVESLAPARVECVITIRDLGRTIAAAWQEFVQNRETWTWEEFLEGISRNDPLTTAAGRLFWSQQGVERQLRLWAEELSPDRIHVVTLPQPGADPELLMQRFAQVIGIELDRYESAAARRNESLGLESAILMQRVNVALNNDLGVSAYNENVKHLLAKEYLATLKPQESNLVVPKEYRPWVSSTSERLVESIRSSGVDVVGSLGDLSPSYRKDGIQPSDVSTEAVLAAAVHGLAEMARSRAALLRQLQRVRDRRGIGELPPPPPIAPPAPASLARRLVRRSRVAIRRRRS